MRRQTDLLIGHTTSNSVKIWMRAFTPSAKGTLELIDGNSKVRPYQITFDEVRSNTEVIVIDGLTPATHYRLRLIIVGDPTHYSEGSFVTFPSENEFQPFSFMFSSCLLQVKYIGKESAIFPHLHRIRNETKSSFMLHCGDQIYVDTTSGSTPINPDYCIYSNCYDDNWSLSGAADFFSSGSNYMMLDDHEIANDFDNSEAHLARNKLFGIEAYNNFQGRQGPDTMDDELFYSFQFGDVHFFVLDTRSERNKDHGLMISRNQETRLLDWLDSHKNELKVIVTPVPFVIQVQDGPIVNRNDQWGGISFFHQRRRINNHLVSNNHNKVFFITGDLHSAVFGEQHFSKSDETGLRHVEFMAGPLNQYLVNGRWAFLKKRSEKDENQSYYPAPGYYYKYERKGLSHRKFNACVISVSRTNLHYVIEANWYDVQSDRRKPLMTRNIEIPIE